jgi:hypothetical protein
MLTVLRRGTELRRRFLEAQSRLNFTYKEVGATAGKPPESYAIDHTRVALGSDAKAICPGIRGGDDSRRGTSLAALAIPCFFRQLLNFSE